MESSNFSTIITILAALIGAASSIIVNIIQVRNEKKLHNSNILLPSNVELRRPKNRVNWLVILLSSFFGGVIGYITAVITNANSLVTDTGNSTIAPIEITKVILISSGIVIIVVLLVLVAVNNQVEISSLFDLLKVRKPRQRVIMKNPKRDLSVFLCHSSDDKPTVEKFYKTLLKEGINAWFDKEALIPGQDWQIEIPKAVTNSDVVVVFLSSQSITKEGYVQKEIKIALDTADEKPEGTIFIIPVRLEDCKVPDRLARFQWVDLYAKNGYKRLYNALQLRADNLGITLNRNRSVT